MKSAIRFAWLSAALAICTLPVVGQSADASAQASATASTPPVTGQVLQQRQDKQQAVIDNGMKDGKLTAGEAGKLEGQENKLDREESAMKKVDDGHLTAAEKEKIMQQQNRITDQIKQDERNNAKQSADATNTIRQREDNQQDRIAQGVKSGALNAGQAAQLEKNEAKINNEVRKDSAANGGKLTAQEKAQVNNQLNHQSMQIHQAMHGGGGRR
jgi:hypothetical protein